MSDLEAALRLGYSGTSSFTDVCRTFAGCHDVTMPAARLLLFGVSWRRRAAEPLPPAEAVGLKFSPSVATALADPPTSSLAAPSGSSNRHRKLKKPNQKTGSRSAGNIASVADTPRARVIAELDREIRLLHAVRMPCIEVLIRLGFANAGQLALAALQQPASPSRGRPRNNKKNRRVVNARCDSDCARHDRLMRFVTHKAPNRQLRARLQCLRRWNRLVAPALVGVPGQRYGLAASPALPVVDRLLRCVLHARAAGVTNARIAARMGFKCYDGSGDKQKGRGSANSNSTLKWIKRRRSERPRRRIASVANGRSRDAIARLYLFAATQSAAEAATPVPERLERRMRVMALRRLQRCLARCGWDIAKSPRSYL